jgi:hypothetical protein
MQYLETICRYVIICRYMSVYLGIVIVQIEKYLKIHADTYEYIQYLHIVI